MKTINVSRLVLLLGAVVLLAALALASVLGWMSGHNNASAALARERLGMSISVWQSLDTGQVKEAQELIEVEIASAAVEVAALDGFAADGPGAAYQSRLRIVADRCGDPELRQTLRSLIQP